MPTLHAPSQSSPGQPGAASALLGWQLRLAHRLLEDTLDAIPHEIAVFNGSAQAHAGQRHETRARTDGGVPVAPAACYAQVVFCEDVTVHAALAGGRPLALAIWAGRTGLDDLPPLGRSIVQPVAEQPDWSDWGRRVRIDLAALREYARAVHAATERYVATLPDALLDPARRELPGCLLNALLLTLSMRRGEIATLAAIDVTPR
jgi:hypothetical protein